METFAERSVVLVAFPFSDLSHAKLRPAVVLAYAGRDDWILCQITSRPYGDAQALAIIEKDFESGSLLRDSYVRPGKLFTGNRSIIESSVGVIKIDSFARIIESVIAILRASLNVS